MYYMSNEAATKAGYAVFDSMPTTFLIDKVSNDNQLSLLNMRFKEIALGNFQYESMPSKHCTSNVWLVKPTYMNQGRGIGVFRNLREITEYIFQQN